MELRIKRAPRIEAEITVPGDKSISHRAAIIAGLSNGICNLRGFLPSDDCMHTVNALRALGIQIEQPDPDVLVVHGKKRVLTPPKEEIDCGGSGTTMRLLAGLLAGQTFESRLVGNPSLTRRPMDRIIEPLRKMGADIVAEGPEQTPPLRIRGGSLRGIHYRSPIASAQVKSAILLAGLFAKGKTTVDEPFASRNHTELMFNYFLVRTAKDNNGAVSVFATDTTDVVLDINGYFTSTGNSAALAFYPLTPCRIADTRNANGPSGGPALAGGDARSFPATGVCGIPSTAKAIAVNLAVYLPSDAGDLRAYPSGGSAPMASSLNFRAGVIRSNSTFIPVGSGGQVTIQCDMASGGTNVFFDVFGYFQ